MRDDAPPRADRRRWIGGVPALVAAAAGLGGADAARARTLAAIEALAPGESRVLGEAAVDGDFNATARRYGLDETGPRARNYCLKMVWAPERRTAIYLGANHGVPHRLNDVWEFDLAALRWTLLYAPDLPRDYKGLGTDASDVVFRDGVLRTQRGGPAIIGHTWSGVTWDPERQRVWFMNAWPADVDAAIRRVGGDPARRAPGPPLWSFDPAERRWQPIVTPPPHPRAAFGGLLEHVPDLGGAIWHMNNWQLRRTWLYDGESNRWRDLRANGGGQAFREHAPVAEVVGYHDAARRLVVTRVGERMHHFDVAARRWTRLAAPARADGAASAAAVALAKATAASGAHVPRGHSARTAFVHDAASGDGLLFDTPSRTLWRYRIGAGTWSRLAWRGPPPPTRGPRPLCYADAARSVIVVVDDRTVWCGRVGPA